MLVTVKKTETVELTRAYRFGSGGILDHAYDAVKDMVISNRERNLPDKALSFPPLSIR
jgi:hypothetical protein